MTNENLRMQMLAGVITEGEYTAVINKQIEEADKESLNESMIGGIVGIGAINQIPATPKTDYELAFEHYLGEKYGLNEVEIEKAKIEEGVFGDLLSRMENNTRMAADIFTVIALAKKDKEGNADKAVELLMKNHDLSEEEAIEAVTRIFKKAFEWADTMEEGKEGETSDMEDKVADEVSMNEEEGGGEELIKKIKNLDDFGFTGDKIEFKGLLITASTQEDEDKTPHYFVYGEDDESEDGIFSSTNPEEVAEFVLNY
jgi:hypothetical protein